MNLARRTIANLVAIALVSAALIVYALASLLTGALLDDSYPLSVEVPNTGGLIPQQEVTLSGVPVGLVESFDLVGEGVTAKLSIDEGRRIPRDVDVVILRRSAVGEQAIDFRPHEGAGNDFFEPGDTVTPANVVTPVEVQRLLTLADEVFGPVDPENAGKVVAELADIVRGRRDDIRSIITDSAEFSADIADNGEAYDRLFREGRKVTAALAENREDLTRSLDAMADAAAVLSDSRTEFEGLLAEMTPLLGQVSTLVNRSDANLSCMITDFADINEYMASDRQMANTEKALRLNQWFFVGYDITSEPDHAGRIWNRIQFIPPQQPPARTYMPAKRPIPDILPGGACSSQLGEGAGSATQASYKKTVPEARIVRPPNDRRQDVRVAGGPIGSGSGSAGSGSGSGGTFGRAGTGSGASGAVAGPPAIPAQGDAGPLAGTGAALLSLLLGVLLIAAGIPPPAHAFAAASRTPTQTRMNPVSDGLPGTGTDPSVVTQDDARIPEAEPPTAAGPAADAAGAPPPEEPVVKGLDRGRAGRSGLAWAVGILSVLLVVAVAFAVVAGINWADLYAAERSRGEVREQATDLVLSLTTFEGANIEEWVADAQARATGGYAEQLSTLFDQSLRDALREQEVVSRGEVEKLFVQEVDGDEASVFALVTQTIVNATTSDPVQDELRMDITMERVDGEWLASDVAVLGPAGLVGGAPEAPQAPAIDTPSTEGDQ